MTRNPPDELNLNQGEYVSLNGHQRKTSKEFIMHLSPEEFLARNEDPDASFFNSANGILSARFVTRKTPKRLLEMQQCTRSDIEAARYACVVKSEARQCAAFERRINYLENLRKRKILKSIYYLQVLQRKEQMHAEMKKNVLTRQWKGIQRAEEVRRRVIEKARRRNCQVDEVVFIKETDLMSKDVLLRRKMEKVRKYLKEKLAEKVRRAKKRNEAIGEAAERRKELLKAKKEKELARAQQWVDREKKIIEFRTKEMEFLKQKAEAWGEKIKQHQLASEALTQALMKKLADKARQSELVLKARDEKIKEKIRIQAQKLKEAKERRDRLVEINFSYREVMSSYDTEEEQGLLQKLSSALEASQRHFKFFLEGYQQKSSFLPKELSRSKVKNYVARLSSLLSYDDFVQCRPTLADISKTDLAPIDHEYIRHFGALELITKVIVSSRKNRLFTVIKQAVDTLIFLFRLGSEGVHHAAYFVRSGLYSQIIIAAHNEANSMRRNSLTANLALLLGCIATVMEVLCGPSEHHDSKVTSARDLMIKDAERLVLDRIYFTVLKMCLASKDLELTYIALRIISVTLSLPSRSPRESSELWNYYLAVSLFALLQNIITVRAGSPKTSLQSCLPASPGKLTCSQLALIFCALRQLNILARKHLILFQKIFQVSFGTCGSINEPSGSSKSRKQQPSAENTTGGILHQNSVNNSSRTYSNSPFSGYFPALITRMELFHFFRQFFVYIHDHWCDFETIPVFHTTCLTNLSDMNGRSAKPTASIPKMEKKSGKPNSFSNAERFGLTLPCLPPLPSIAMMEKHKDLYVPCGNCYHLRAALHECILLVGYLCLDNASVKEIFSWGGKISLLEEVINALPAGYFTNVQHIFFPSLLCIVDNDDRNLRLLQKNVDVQLLQDFLEEEMRHMSKKARQNAVRRAEEIKDYRNALDAFLEKEGESPSSFSEIPSEEVDKELLKGSADTTIERAQPLKLTQSKLEKCPVQEHSVTEKEKESLFKNLKPNTVEFTDFFRIEKRVPTGFWPLLSDQLSAALQK